jgi:DNA anti-recombination protein RmuC
MALTQEDLERIKQELGAYVKANLSDWLAEQSLGKPPVVYEIELRERMVRVEEELKHQRELMREGFAQMDKRFTALQTSMDQRFEAMQTTMDQRFEAMQTTMDQRFEAMQTSMDQRFEQVDKRFEQVDKRFEGVQQDIRNLQQRMDSFMRWSFGITIGVGGLIIGVLKLWP